MCGGASGCRSDITHSRQSDRYRAAASGQTLIRWAGVTSTPARGSKRGPPLARSPIFISTGGVKSIDRNEISRPGELPLIDMRVDYSDDSSKILWEDGERVFRRGWRLDDNGKRAVLIVQ